MYILLKTNFLNNYLDLKLTKNVTIVYYKIYRKPMHIDIVITKSCFYLWP